MTANRRANRRARRRARRASADCVDLHSPFKLLVVGRWCHWGRPTWRCSPELALARWRPNRDMLVRGASPSTKPQPEAAHVPAHPQMPSRLNQGRVDHDQCRGCLRQLVEPRSSGVTVPTAHQTYGMHDLQFGYVTLGSDPSPRQASILISIHWKPERKRAPATEPRASGTGTVAGPVFKLSARLGTALLLLAFMPCGMWPRTSESVETPNLTSGCLMGSAPRRAWCQCQWQAPAGRRRSGGSHTQPQAAECRSGRPADIGRR